MYEVVWSRAALAEVDDIYNHVLDLNPEAAIGLAAALLEAASNLAEFPLRGRTVVGNLRELVSVYPYIIRYDLVGNSVQILRVRHGMRRQ